MSQHSPVCCNSGLLPPNVGSGGVACVYIYRYVFIHLFGYLSIYVYYICIYSTHDCGLRMHGEAVQCAAVHVPFLAHEWGKASAQQWSGRASCATLRKGPCTARLARACVKNRGLIPTRNPPQGKETPISERSIPSQKQPSIPRCRKAS